MYVCLNGEILPIERANVSVLDHGFLYGAGLFETMRTVGGRPMFWDAHYLRLAESCQALQQKMPWSSDELHDLVFQTVRANELELDEAYVRLTVTRGPGQLGPSGKTCETPTLVIYVKPLVLPPAETYQRGRDLLLLETRRSTPETTVRVKSLNYLNSLLAYAELEARGGGEGIQLTHDGFVAEGAVSNLFFVVHGELWTPSAETGILPGVTRAWVLETVRERGIPTREHRFTLNDLTQATEAFTTSSVVGILPAVSIEKTPIYTGTPGPITQLLIRKWDRKLSQKVPAAKGLHNFLGS
ncbi:aminotransferase class IV [Tumebacillus sp. ITR2]|uniref:Aminotransferase class IV n=1 Tax=Tumebacillus amylolyticus TaxID=2801339 RepID=A0ABS1JDE1_9BACL|nr:aminotransferase class IV [Tumebacillus amylolyticus]MBL0388281.1 aminotransferase class IV [Tumebacillus amylolyticus]